MDFMVAVDVANGISYITTLNDCIQKSLFDVMKFWVREKLVVAKVGCKSHEIASLKMCMHTVIIKYTKSIISQGTATH